MTSALSSAKPGEVLRLAAAHALAGQAARKLIDEALARTLEAFVADGFEVRFWSEHAAAELPFSVSAYRQAEVFDPTSGQNFWLQATLTVLTDALQVGAGQLEWTFISRQTNPETGEVLRRRLGFDFVKTSSAVSRPDTAEAFTQHLEHAWRTAHSGEHAQDWEAHGRRIAADFAGVLAP